MLRDKKYSKSDVFDFELVIRHLVKDDQLEINNGRYVDGDVHKAFLEFLEFEWQVRVNCEGT